MTKAPRKPAPPAPPAAASAEGERIAKVLSRAGIASRREAERLIEAGEVAVNGKTITSPALNVGPRDRITVRGEAVGQPEPARLWLYYKPDGLVTSASDEKGRETVFDHLPEGMPRVMSVGRLDLNSEGLLLLTNDGELKRRLELPSTGWLRKYRVRVRGNPTDPDLEPLRHGITVEGESFQPMQVVLDRHQGANAWLTIGLREGKNREIRRAIAAIGLIVNRLIRISYGPFRLNELQPGEVEEVRPRVLRDQLGLTGEASDELQTPTPRPGFKPAPRPAKPRQIDDSDPAKRARRSPTKPAATGEKPRAPSARAGAGERAGKPAATAATGQTRRLTTKPAGQADTCAARRPSAKPAPAKPAPAGAEGRAKAAAPRGGAQPARAQPARADRDPHSESRARPAGPAPRADRPALAPRKAGGPAKPGLAKPGPAKPGPAKPPGGPGKPRKG